MLCSKLIYRTVCVYFISLHSFQSTKYIIWTGVPKLLHSTVITEKQNITSLLTTHICFFYTTGVDYNIDFQSMNNNSADNNHLSKLTLSSKLIIIFTNPQNRL